MSSPEKSLLQFVVRLLLQPKKTWFLYDSARLVNLNTVSFIKIDRYPPVKMFPNYILNFVRVPVEVIEWLLGIGDVQYMNLIQNTEIVRRKAIFQGKK